MPATKGFHGYSDLRSQQVGLNDRLRIISCLSNLSFYEEPSRFLYCILHSLSRATTKDISSICIVDSGRPAISVSRF